MSDQPPYSFVYDDQSPLFTYQGEWASTQDPNAYLGTLRSTDQIANATISFNGTEVSLYAVVGKSATYGQPTVNLYLDGEYDASQSGYVWNVQETEYNQLYYSATGLKDEQHTVIIENAVEGETLFLDYVLGPNLRPTTGNSVQDDQLARTVTSFIPAPTKEDASSSASGTKSAPVKALIGGILGGVAFSVLIAVGIFFYRRKKHGAAYYYKTVNDPAEILDEEFHGAKEPPPSLTTQISPSEKPHRAPSYYDDQSSVYTVDTVDLPTPQRAPLQSGIEHGNSRPVRSHSGSSSISSIRPLMLHSHSKPDIGESYKTTSLGRGASALASSAASTFRARSDSGRSSVSSIRPLMLGKGVTQTEFGHQRQSSIPPIQPPSRSPPEVYSVPHPES